MTILNNDTIILKARLETERYETETTFQKIIVSLDEFLDDNNLVTNIIKALEKKFSGYYDVVNITVSEGVFSGVELYNA